MDIIYISINAAGLSVHVSLALSACLVHISLLSSCHRGPLWSNWAGIIKGVGINYSELVLGPIVPTKQMHELIFSGISCYANFFKAKW